MKRSSTLFFQTAIVLIGIAALAFMLGEPHLEGRNVNATLFQIYFNDPFLVFAYIASIPFFVGLYHAFKVLGCVEQGKALVQSAVKSLQIIKYCAMAVIGFVVLGEVFILLNESDDRAGGVFIGLLIALASIGVVIAVALFQRILQTASKNENGMRSH